MYRRTFLKIDMDRYVHNINYLRQHAQKELIAVVKANAYGAGISQAVSYALKAGIAYFAVSSLEEALQVRKIAKEATVQILGYVDLAYLDIVKENNFSLLTINDSYFDDVDDLSGLSLTIKVDTGMNRVGVYPDKVKEVLNKLLAKGALVEGIMTHFSRSDEEDEVFSMKQYALFKECIASLDHEFKYIHCCNSDATLNFKDEISTHVRCGIALWGYSNFADKLEKAISLHTEVINCKQVKEGEGISYGGRYISDGAGYILTLPIGYADGIWRSNTGNEVYIAAEKGKIVGSICMDLMMIKTTKAYKVGTPVEIFGDHISLYDIANKLQTIPYEILTGISDRVARIYVSENQEIGEELPRFH